MKENKKSPRKKRAPRTIQLKDGEGNITTIETCDNCTFKSNCPRRSMEFRGGKLQSVTVRCSEFQ